MQKIINVQFYVFAFRAEKIYEEYNQFRAVISSRGLIHWEPGGRL